MKFGSEIFWFLGGIYGGIVKRDESGQIVIGRLHLNLNLNYQQQMDAVTPGLNAQCDLWQP